MSRLPGAARGDQPLRSEIGVADMLARGQHGDDGLHVLGGFACGGGDGHASASELRHGRLRQVENLEAVAGLDQVGGHWPAHVAEPDKADFRHPRLLDILMKLGGRGVELSRNCEGLRRRLPTSPAHSSHYRYKPTPQLKRCYIMFCYFAMQWVHLGCWIMDTNIAVLVIIAGFAVLAVLSWEVHG